MRKKILFAYMLIRVCCVFAEVTSINTEQAFAIMENAERILAYNDEYSATISLIVEKPGKLPDNYQFKLFQRSEKNLMTLVQLFPEADKGKGFLRDGDNIWAYEPVSRKFIHSSLKENLAGTDLKLDDMSHGKTKWQMNYDVVDVSETKLGKFDVYKITLIAKTSDPIYFKVSYYIRKDIPLILKEEDYSSSNRLMRTVLIPKYSKLPQGYVMVHILIRDELNKGECTQQIVSDLIFDKMPDYLFRKSYLEGLN